MHSLVTLLLALHLLAPISVHAATDITAYSLKHWGFILGMALLGGFVNWWGQVRRGELKASSFSSLVGELCTSAFAGLLAFFICEWANFPQMLTAAMTGICGHMGTRAVSMFERWAEKKFDVPLDLRQLEAKKVIADDAVTDRKEADRKDAEGKV